MATYTGGCHCGAIRFEAEGDLTGLEVCNCSLCAKLGYLHWFIAPEQFRLVAGEGAFETYQFGTKTSRNHFCRRCGIVSFRRARSDPNLVDINVRCLDNVDPAALHFEPFDGLDWEQAMARRK